MPESPEQYKQRLLSYTIGQDPLVIQRTTPGLLQALLDGVDSASLSRRTAPGMWSICEIAAHLADDELVGAYRIRRILSDSGTAIEAFDQDKWAETGRYSSRDVRDSLELFQALRAGNLRLYSSLTPEEWEQYGIHAERGVETLRDIARHFAGHDINHLNQIRAMLSGR